MTKELIAIIEGREMGRVARDNRGKLSFTYNEQWRNAPDAYPLSISMPLALTEHGNAKVDPYLWGLLPDNSNVLDQWGKRFHVSPRNAFGLIANVGEDCAGAVQFVQPERLDAILGQAPPEIEWLDDAAIAQRLRTLRADHSAWRIPRDTGQFSLAGAQPKTAFLLENGRWGVPSGRMPTTHILKPPTGDLDGHVENEHFCLELARSLGLPTVSSRIMHFQDEIAIVVERYDRELSVSVRKQPNLQMGRSDYFLDFAHQRWRGASLRLTSSTENASGSNSPPTQSSRSSCSGWAGSRMASRRL